MKDVTIDNSPLIPSELSLSCPAFQALRLDEDPLRRRDLGLDRRLDGVDRLLQFFGREPRPELQAEVDEEVFRPHVEGEQLDHLIDLRNGGDGLADFLEIRRRGPLADQEPLALRREKIGDAGKKKADQNRGDPVDGVDPGPEGQADSDHGDQNSDPRERILDDHGDQPEVFRLARGFEERAATEGVTELGEPDKAGVALEDQREDQNRDDPFDVLDRMGMEDLDDPLVDGEGRAEEEDRSRRGEARSPYAG
jgi:hypothetical protein